MQTVPDFSYVRAFDRNLGWLTEWEQQSLRFRRVAVAGLGGVGGSHLLTLARLGIGAFSIADFDRFDLANFNRQVGATMRSLGRPKVDVLAEMALDINPELRLRRFPDGVQAANIDAFLEGVDLFVDGLDFFVLDLRRKVFARCWELGIPAVTAAPIGMGAGYVIFAPGGMSFEQYFRLEGRSEPEQYLRFLMGMAPRGLHRRYLVDPGRVDLAGKRGPSTVAACQLCAGVTGVAAVKLLLRRADLAPAPAHHHFDAYRGRFATTRLRFGNAGPLQSVKLAVARRAFAGMSRRARTAPASFAPRTILEEILDIARWAPSGDNSQPWQFRIVGEDALEIRVEPADPANPYEYRAGEPKLLSAGTLLENLRIAASGWGRAVTWSARGEASGTVIEAGVTPAAAVEPDRLLPFLMLRSVDRGPYRLTGLTAAQKERLERALGERLNLRWHESFADRRRLAALSARATDIRLRMPQAYAVHHKVIDWDRALSPSGIPATAAGLAPASLGMMRWAMRDWSRLRWLNAVGGTWLSAAQMDILPGVASAGYFSVAPRNLSLRDAPVASLLDGQDVQRFWLTAEQLGLVLQPALAVLIFAEYGATGSPFVADPELHRRAGRLATGVEGMLGAPASSFVFLGRIGTPRSRQAFRRSIRKTIPELMMEA